MSVHWAAIWLKLFGTTQMLGLDMGFWVSMGISAVVAILMNLVFWSLKPKHRQ